jgi:hypothetical protein
MATQIRRFAAMHDRQIKGKKFNINKKGEPEAAPLLSKD